MNKSVFILLWAVFALVCDAQQIRWNLYNRRGDVVGQVDSTGKVTWQASYEAFGKRTQEFGTNNDRQRGNTKEEDPTGLLNEGMRYRCLETGVFITRDPLGVTAGPNFYTYVSQNPWTKFDPHGLAEVMPNGMRFLTDGGYRHYQGNADPEREDPYPGQINTLAVEHSANRNSASPAVQARLDAKVDNFVSDDTHMTKVVSLDNAIQSVQSPGEFTPIEAFAAGGAYSASNIKPGMVTPTMSARDIRQQTLREVEQASKPNYRQVPDPKNVGPGKHFTRRQVVEYRKANAQFNDGQMRSDISGKPLVNPRQHRKGVTPPSNEAHVDHIDPRSEGGSNSSKNAQVISREENLKKSNKK
jgi:RHS repeat-associated protein